MEIALGRRPDIGVTEAFAYYFAEAHACVTDAIAIHDMADAHFNPHARAPWSRLTLCLLRDIIRARAGEFWSSTVTIIPVRLTLELPPGAHLPQARERLQRAIRLLDRGLEPTRRFRPADNSAETDLRLAVALHALNALDSASAVHVLSNTDFPVTVAPHFRTVFETFLKIKYMRQDPKRATNYLDSNTFECYAHANATVKKSPRWVEIVAKCKAEVQRRPELLKLKDAIAKDGSHDYSAIAKGLRFPSTPKLVRAAKEHEDAYLLDFDVPSFASHSSVMYTKSYGRNRNRDGTLTLSTELDPIMHLMFVTRTAVRAGQVLDEVLTLFHDGALQYEAGQDAKELTAFAMATKGYLPQGWDSAS